MFSMGRDRRLPLGRVWGHVSPTFKTPANAAVAVGVLAALPFLLTGSPAESCHRSDGDDLHQLLPVQPRRADGPSTWLAAEGGVVLAQAMGDHDQHPGPGLGWGDDHQLRPLAEPTSSAPSAPRRTRCPMAAPSVCATCRTRSWPRSASSATRLRCPRSRSSSWSSCSCSPSASSTTSPRARAERTSRSSRRTSPPAKRQSGRDPGRAIAVSLARPPRAHHDRRRGPPRPTP